MNNGGKDTSNSDVQRLQEQLNDIKEQVLSIGQCFRKINRFCVPGPLCVFNEHSFFFTFADNVPSVSGPFEKYDLLVRTWNLSDVWRPNVGMPYLSESRWTKNTLVLIR